MIRRPPRSTQSRSSAASDVYKRQARGRRRWVDVHAAQLRELCRCVRTDGGEGGSEVRGGSRQGRLDQLGQIPGVDGRSLPGQLDGVGAAWRRWRGLAAKVAAAEQDRDGHRGQKKTPRRRAAVT